MIHPTVIIHPTAKIADNVEIGPYSIIGENTKIESGTKIGANSIIEFAEIGHDCQIFSHAAIGTAPQDYKYNNEPTKIVLGPRCVIREFATLSRGSLANGKTLIGSDCMFMAYSHVAHDCTIGNNVVMANAATLGGHVEIGDFAVIAGLVAVHQFTRIGRVVMVGGGAMVSLDILPYTQAQGDRAKLVGLNLVGIKRRNIPAHSIEDIKSAYRILFLTGIPLEEAIDQLQATANPCKEVLDIIEFLQTSRRGICRPSRKENFEEV